VSARFLSKWLTMAMSAAPCTSTDAPHTPTPAALLTFGTAVAAFLALVGQALFSQS